MARETITGEVTQLIHPGDEYEYSIPETGREMFRRGYSSAVIRFDEVPLANKVFSNPFLAVFHLPVNHLLRKTGHAKHPDEFSRVVWVRDPEFDVGDEVTMKAEEMVVQKRTGTALVAGDSR